MTRYRPVLVISLLLVFGAALSLVACSVGPSQPEPVGTPMSASVNSPTSLGGGIARSTLTPAIGAAGSYTGTVTATVDLTGTPPSRSTTVTATRTATGTPAPTRTPSNTPTPAPSRALLTAAGTLETKVGAYLQALGGGSLDAQLQAQRDLLDAVAQTETALKDDQSKVGEKIRAAVSAIHDGINGDQGKLKNADSLLREALGLTSAGQSGSSSTGDLQQIKAALADKVVAFQSALQAGQPGGALRQQNELLDQVSKTEEAIKNVHTNEADQVRSAIEDIRGGLAGDRARLDSAVRKLGGGATATPSPAATARSGATPSAAATSTADIQALARSLDDSLSHWTTAQQEGKTDEMTRLQKEIEQEMAKAQDAVASDHSPTADQLRSAIQALREAFGGDQNKMNDARNRLRDILAR